MSFRPPASLAVGLFLPLATLASASSATQLVASAPSPNPAGGPPTTYGFLVSVTNHDGSCDQTIYNSFRVMSGQIFALGQHSSASVADLIRDQYFFVLLGNASMGWGVDPQADGGLVVMPVDEGATAFSDGEELKVFASFSCNLLELNGVAGHQAFTLEEAIAPDWDPSAADAVPVRSDDPRLLAPNYQGPAAFGDIPDAFIGIDSSGPEEFQVSGLQYVLLDPGDFAAPATFYDTHPGLDPEADENHNRRSNFLDYAIGDDPQGGTLSLPLEISGTTLTMRYRVNAADVLPTLEGSEDLAVWSPLAETVDYTVVSRDFEGSQQVLVVELNGPPPARRFLRLDFADPEPQ